MEKVSLLYPKDCIWIFEYFCPFWMYENPFGVCPVMSTLIVSSGGVHVWIQRGSFIVVLNHKPFQEGISLIYYNASWGLLDAKVNQVMPCFNITWKSKGSLLTMHLILNLSLNFTVTDFSKLILFPFKVMLTSYQSKSITCQSIFLFNLTFSGVKVPVILNKCMLPTILPNFIGK